MSRNMAQARSEATPQQSQQSTSCCWKTYGSMSTLLALDGVEQHTYVLQPTSLSTADGAEQHHAAVAEHQRHE
ncbi:unnamed protein product [Cylicostephanus goldi]|uniref:Uncharacterized protein n=1 Tax=Cylicostephanus goldi TaxID=71465 RepID=A0A3P6RUY3_CYLGO|nr:unnamed protein product [Cylicostephanus goldi]